MIFHLLHLLSLPVIYYKMCELSSSKTNVDHVGHVGSVATVLTFTWILCRSHAVYIEMRVYIGITSRERPGIQYHANDMFEARKTQMDILLSEFTAIYDKLWMRSGKKRRK